MRAAGLRSRLADDHVDRTGASEGPGLGAGDDSVVSHPRHPASRGRSSQGRSSQGRSSPGTRAFVTGPAMTQGRPVIAVLGLGEAGSLIAADLAAAGAVVRAYDPVVRAAQHVIHCNGDADACRGAAV